MESLDLSFCISFQQPQKRVRCYRRKYDLVIYIEGVKSIDIADSIHCIILPSGTPLKELPDKATVHLNSGNCKLCSMPHRFNQGIEKEGCLSPA